MTKWACIILYVAIILITFTQVFFRYVIGHPLTAAEELARYFFVWLILLGSATTIWSEGHIKLTFLTDKLPIKIKLLLKLLTDLLIAVIEVRLLIYEGFRLAIFNMRQISPATDLPIGWIYMAIPIGGILMFFATVFQIINSRVTTQKVPKLYK